MVDIKILKELEFFKPFTDEELKVFSQRLIVEEYKDGEFIFNENQIGDYSMFLIVNGAVKVTKKQKVEEKVIANLKEGEFFGEMAMLFPAPRSASVSAIKPTKVLRLSDMDYNSFKKEYPTIVVKLNEIFIKVLVSRLREADKKLVKEGYGLGIL